MYQTLLGSQKRRLYGFVKSAVLKKDSDNRKARELSHGEAGDFDEICKTFLFLDHVQREKMQGTNELGNEVSRCAY